MMEGFEQQLRRGADRMRQRAEGLDRVRPDVSALEARLRLRRIRQATTVTLASALVVVGLVAVLGHAREVGLVITPVDRSTAPSSGSEVEASACGLDDPALAPESPPPIGTTVDQPPRRLVGAKATSTSLGLVFVTGDPPAAAILDVDRGSWRCLPAPPLRGPLSVAVGESNGALLILAVGAEDAAFYDGAEGRWVTLPPRSAASGSRPHAVAWTGEQFLLVEGAPRTPGGTPVSALAPAGLEWTTLPAPPVVLDPLQRVDLHVLDGNALLLAAPRAARLDLDTGEWSAVDGPPLEGRTLATTVVGVDVFGVDYRQQWSHTPVLDMAWTPPASTGLDDVECLPALAATTSHLYTGDCGPLARRPITSGGWTTITDPDSRALTLAATTSDEIFLWWTTTHGEPDGQWALLRAPG